MVRPQWLRSRLYIPPLVFLLVYLAHFLRLSGSSYPSGWDAYFYLIQVKALIEEGAMHSPDASPIYVLLKWLYFICGDYEIAFQHLCAGLAGIFSFFLCALALRLSQNTLIGICLGLWCLASPSLAFFAANFPKNLLGVDFLLLLFFFSLGRGWVGSALAFLFTALSHRMTAGLGFLFMGFRILNLRTLLFVLLGLAGILLVSLALPGLLHFSDLQRFEGSLDTNPQLPHLVFIQLLDLTHTQPIWVVEIVLSALLWFWALVTLIFRGNAYGEQFRFYRSLFLLCIVLFFPFLVVNVTSMGYRFFLTGMLIIPIFLVAVLDQAGWLARFCGAVFLVVFSVWGMKTIDTAQYDPDYEKYDWIVEQITVQFSGEDPELVIAHKGLAEVITYQTGIDALPWLPEYNIPPSQLYRIASEVSEFEIEAILNRPLGPKSRQLGISYLLLPEADWQEFVAQVEENGQDEELLERIYQWQNPMEIRPSYLLRNKPDQ